MWPFSPCQASRGHSISLNASFTAETRRRGLCSEGGSCLQDPHLKLRHVRVQACGLKRQRDCIACFHRIDELVEPQTRGTVAGIHLLVVGVLHFVVQSLLVLVTKLLAAALKLFQLDFYKCSRRRFT